MKKENIKERISQIKKMEDKKINIKTGIKTPTTTVTLSTLGTPSTLVTLGTHYLTSKS